MSGSTVLTSSPVEWGRVRRFLRSDSMGLFILAVATIARGVSYLSPFLNPNRNPAHWLEGLMQPTLWAWVWIAGGLLALASCFASRLQPAALGITVGLHTAWALSFIGSTMTGDTSRGWVSAISYITILALSLWAFGRGQREEIAIKHTRG